MKHNLFFLAMCLMCCACSSDENIGGTSAVKNISATLEPMTFDGQTRTSHTVSDTQGFLSEWAEGDILGIYPVGGDQVAFPISAGAGTSTAKFDGGSWALRPAVKYSAYYPFCKDNYMISQTEIPVNYVGQSQNGNASTAHLGNYYYVAAAATEPTSTGSVNLAMKHMGSLLNLILTMPVAASYSDVVVETETEGEFFPTTGTIDLTSTAPAITPKTYAHSIHLGLTNVSTTSTNQTISLLMMMAPANMLDKNLLVTVTDTEGKTYQFKGAGKAYLAAKAYRLTLTEVIGGTGANLTPDGWDDPDANMHNGHEYVDLGLKDEQGRTIFWATCNVGATSPEECGDYFAWGETDIKETYYWSNYKWSEGSYNTLTKYCTSPDFGTVDNNTTLKLEDDAAQAKWHGSWRIPTKAELNSLIKQCSWEWTSINNLKGEEIKGYKISNKIDNSKSIFLPATGIFFESRISNVGTFGNYMSSSLDSQNFPHYCFCITFFSGSFDPYGGERFSGRSIRPVCILSE